MLYRATRDSFRVAKFHEKCDNIFDTLTLVRTTKQKVLGGYTPLPWELSDGQYYGEKSNK